MSLPSHAHERETEFLVSLRDELANGPSAATCRRQIAAAASEARRISRVKRLELGGLSALVVAVLLLGGTSRVAVAGSLPHRVQGLVAEAARLLPVPIPVPFPTTAGMTLPPASILDATAVDASAESDVIDAGGGTEVEQVDPAPVAPTASNSPTTQPGAGADREGVEETTDAVTRYGGDRHHHGDEASESDGYQATWDEQDGDHDRDELAWGGDDDRDGEGDSDRDEDLSWGDRDWGSGHEERNPQDDWRRDGDRS